MTPHTNPSDAFIIYIHLQTPCGLDSIPPAFIVTPAGVAELVTIILIAKLGHGRRLKVECHGMGNATKLHIVGSQKAKIWSLSPCCAALTGAISHISYLNKHNQKYLASSGIIWHHLANLHIHIHRNIRTYQDNDDSVCSATTPSGSTGRK